jgi:hypothetical protein
MSQPSLLSTLEFVDHRLDLRAMNLRDVTHEMVIPQPSGATVARICLFNDQYPAATFRCPDGSHQTCNAPTDA